MKNEKWKMACFSWITHCRRYLSHRGRASLGKRRARTRGRVSVHRDLFRNRLNGSAHDVPRGRDVRHGNGGVSKDVCHRGHRTSRKASRKLETVAEVVAHRRTTRRSGRLDSPGQRIVYGGDWIDAGANGVQSTNFSWAFRSRKGPDQSRYSERR